MTARTRLRAAAPVAVSRRGPVRATAVPPSASTGRRDPALTQAASARALLAEISALIDGTDLEGA